MLVFQLIVIQIITFVMLIVVLQKVMVTSSYKETKRLQKLNQENADRAKELSERIEESKKQHREKMLMADEEIKRMKDLANKEVMEMKEIASLEIKKEKERLMEQAVNAKERLREEIERQMKERAVNYGLDLVSEILSSRNQQVIHNSFMEEVFIELEKIDEDTLQIKDSQEEIKVQAAFKLTEAQKAKIKEILSQKIGKGVLFKEEENKDCIAGIIINVGNLIIDGTMKTKLNAIAQEMKRI